LYGSLLRLYHDLRGACRRRDDNQLGFLLPEKSFDVESLLIERNKECSENKDRYRCYWNHEDKTDPMADKQYAYRQRYKSYQNRYFRPIGRD
jgi:hypothetical protein